MAKNSFVAEVTYKFIEKMIEEIWYYENAKKVHSKKEFTTTKEKTF